jgi:hypothetical protein
VDAGISTCIEGKLMPAEAIETVEFIEKMDKLFDILNSRKKTADKMQRNALQNPAKGTSAIADLLELKLWIQGWSFDGVPNIERIASHWGFISSITSIVELSRDLFAEGFAYICTARFNQDCIENFFSIIRGKNGWTDNPTPVQFCSAFKNSVVLGALEPANTKSTNCENDTDLTLLSAAESCNDVKTILPQQPPVYVDCPAELQAAIQEEVIIIETVTADTFTHTEETAIPYLAGWVARKVSLCDTCRETLTTKSNVTEYERAFLNHKEYAEGGLYKPSDNLVKVIHIAESEFRSKFNDLKSCSGIAQRLFSEIENAINFQFLYEKHPQHATALARSIIAKYVTMRIHYELKFENAAITKVSTMTHRKLKILKHE